MKNRPLARPVFYCLAYAGMRSPDPARLPI